MSHEPVTATAMPSAEELGRFAIGFDERDRAVERLPSRQREVVQSHYFEAMTQVEVASRLGLAESSVRNSHAGALHNLGRDDELFDVLEAVGKVRDRDRRQALQQLRQAA